MQIIHKKNFISIVCIVYTCMVMFKVAVEGISGGLDESYIQNLICLLVLVTASVFVLGLHYYLQELPVALVIVMQYLLLLGLAMGYVWLSSFSEQPHEDAYQDMFLSLTIPYMVLVPIYYIQFFLQIKKANEILPKLKEKKNEDGS